jgi:hypothetical protein
VRGGLGGISLGVCEVCTDTGNKRDRESVGRGVDREYPGRPNRREQQAPISGPTVRPRYRPVASRLFAHDMFSFPATFGIAAEDAGKNGASNTDEIKAIASSNVGSRGTNAIANQHTAAPDSPTIITRRRS